MAALGSALAAIVARHESLRTRFAVADGRPVQVIGTGSGIGLAQEDATGLTEAGLAARVTAVLEAPFDLERGPLFRAHLLRRGAEEHVLVVGGHHTVLDGWSVGLLLREASALYRGEPLAGLAIQYADYAELAAVDAGGGASCGADGVLARAARRGAGGDRAAAGPGAPGGDGLSRRPGRVSRFRRR